MAVLRNGVLRCGCWRGRRTRRCGRCGGRGRGRRTFGGGRSGGSRCLVRRWCFGRCRCSVRCGCFGRSRCADRRGCLDRSRCAVRRGRFGRSRCARRGDDVLVLQSSKGILDSLRHGVYFALLGNVLTAHNSADSGFYRRKILVVILLQGICFGNGCIYLSIISVLVLQGSNRILYSFRHCINLCLLGFTFCSVNRVNGIFYRRIICIKVTIKSLCTCDSRINSCVISENVIVIPHKSWMADSGNPLNARTGIGLQASKDICGGEVGDSSAAR